MPRELDFFFFPGRSEAVLNARHLVRKGLLFLFQTLPSQSAIGLLLTLKWLQNSHLRSLLSFPGSLLLGRWFSWNVGRFAPLQLEVSN